MAQDAGGLLFGEARRKVLGRLYGHPDQRFFLRQLAREVEAAPGAVQRELVGLVGAGLVTRVTEGRQVYFQANRGSPIFPELQSLLLKTVGAVPLLRDALASLGGRVAVAFIFGSAAKGLLRNESDIDLFVVGDATFADVVGVMSDPNAVHLAARTRWGRLCG